MELKAGQADDGFVRAAIDSDSRAKMGVHT
jgi:hypothetical protein